MLDLIICANFGVEKLRSLGNTRSQILESPIEMAGHPYNRVGATAQPVISQALLYSVRNAFIDKHSKHLLKYAYGPVNVNKT